MPLNSSDPPWRPVRERLRGLPARWPYRGRTRLMFLLDPLLRGAEETPAAVGSIRFPFLAGDDQLLMFYQLYEPTSVAFLRAWLRPGDVFLDVGANAGYLAAVAADCVIPTGRVHAFEPAPAHFARLERLAALNPGVAWKLNAIAVAERDGVVDLFIHHHSGWHTTVRGFRGDEATQCRVIQVPSRSLDSYAAEQGLTGTGAIRLIKIDVEGAEAQVIAGAAKLIRSGAVDALLVELTPLRDRERSRSLADALEFLRQAGFVARLQWTLTGDVRVREPSWIAARLVGAEAPAALPRVEDLTEQVMVAFLRGGISPAGG